MINPKVVNLAASVKDRLFNYARKHKRPVQEVLAYYAIERFLYRLSRSPHKNLFVLKGGLLIRAWQVSEARSTLDIDVLAKTANSPDNLVTIVTDICDLEPHSPDGLSFSTNSIKSDVMQKNQKYSGVRIRFIGHLSKARIPLQIDVGFSDLITPKPQKIVLPTILDFPAPCLKGYPPETVIAEKLQSIMERGMANTRVKDFYDIWLLIRRFSFNNQQLLLALTRTFKQRKTPFQLAALTTTIKEFARLPQTHEAWIRCKQKQLASVECPVSFDTVVCELMDFIESL